MPRCFQRGTKPGLFMNTCYVVRSFRPAGLFSFGLLDELQVSLHWPYVREAPAGFGLERLATVFMKIRAWAGVERSGSLFSDLDVIHVVGGLSEASRGEIAIFFVVQDQSFSHGLREL
jgi:hypothetical protein